MAASSRLEMLDIRWNMGYNLSSDQYRLLINQPGHMLNIMFNNLLLHHQIEEEEQKKLYLEFFILGLRMEMGDKEAQKEYDELKRQEEYKKAWQSYFREAELLWKTYLEKTDTQKEKELDDYIKMSPADMALLTPGQLAHVQRVFAANMHAQVMQQLGGGGPTMTPTQPNGQPIINPATGQPLQLNVPKPPATPQTPPPTTGEILSANPMMRKKLKEGTSAEQQQMQTAFATVETAQDEIREVFRAAQEFRDANPTLLGDASKQTSFSFEVLASIRRGAADAVAAHKKKPKIAQQRLLATLFGVKHAVGEKPDPSQVIVVPPPFQFKIDKTPAKKWAKVVAEEKESKTENLDDEGVDYTRMTKGARRPPGPGGRIRDE